MWCVVWVVQLGNRRLEEELIEAKLALAEALGTSIKRTHRIACAGATEEVAWEGRGWL
jgi:hypothetical protein